MLDAETKLYGLLGNPVSHSLSPFMQNLFLQRAGINGAYLAFAVNNQRIKEVLHGLHALGVGGCNVTIPYKEVVIPYLTGISRTAEACGAVNTLIYQEEGFYGENTDGAGLLKALEAQHQWTAQEASILLIGAGGAAKGVAMAMAFAGAKKIQIINRSLNRAQALAEQLAHYGRLAAEALPLESLQDAGLYQEIDAIVHTTSVGMYPAIHERMPVRLDALEERHLVVDLIYNPLETRLLQEAKARGARVASGLGMFVHQGALAFQHWHHRPPDLTNIEKLVEAQLVHQKESK